MEAIQQNSSDYAHRVRNQISVHVQTLLLTNLEQVTYLLCPSAGFLYKIKINVSLIEL